MYYCTSVLSYVYQMKSVEDKTWNIFKFQTHEQSINIMSQVYKIKSVEDDNWNIYKFKIHEKAISMVIFLHTFMFIQVPNAKKSKQSGFFHCRK